MFWLRLTAEQCDGDVVDIRAGGTGHDETVRFLQSVIGVVVAEHGVHGQTVRRKLFDGVAVRIAAGRVGWSVGTVAADREHGG